MLEASGDSFAIAERLAVLGLLVQVLDSESVRRFGWPYCATNRLVAVKLLAYVYLSGFVHVVWPPDAQSQERPELFFAHRNAVCDAVCAAPVLGVVQRTRGRASPQVSFERSQRPENRIGLEKLDSDPTDDPRFGASALRLAICEAAI